MESTVSAVRTNWGSWVFFACWFLNSSLYTGWSSDRFMGAVPITLLDILSFLSLCLCEYGRRVPWRTYEGQRITLSWSPLLSCWRQAFFVVCCYRCEASWPISQLLLLSLPTCHRNTGVMDMSYHIWLATAPALMCVPQKLYPLNHLPGPGFAFYFIFFHFLG